MFMVTKIAIMLTVLGVLISTGCASKSNGHVTIMGLADAKSGILWTADLQTIHASSELDDLYDTVIDRINSDRLADWGISPESISAVGWSDPLTPSEVGFIVGKFDIDSIREALDILRWRSDNAGEKEVWTSKESIKQSVGFYSETVLVFGRDRLVRDTLTRAMEESLRSSSDVSSVLAGIGNPITVEISVNCKELPGCRARRVSYAANDSGDLLREESATFRRESDAEDAEEQLRSSMKRKDIFSDTVVTLDGSLVNTSSLLEADDYRPFSSFGTITTLLASIPDTKTNSEEIYINDYARIREVFEIRTPDRRADDDEIMDFSLEVMIGPELRSGGRDLTGVIRGPWISGFNEYSNQLI